MNRVEHLFNSRGQWIAFKLGKFIYNKHAEWIGWLPWEDGYAVNKNGEYLGTIIGNRFYRFYSHPYRGYPGYPGYAGYSPLPLGAEDIVGLA